jgi:YVTN family beta-propeller protein
MQVEAIRKKRRCWFAGLLMGPVLAMGTTAPAAATEEKPEEAAAKAVYAGSTYSSPIAISADDRFVWSVNPADDSVSVLRTDTRTVLRKIKVGDEPESVALDPNNRYAFVANAAGSSVTVIRISNADYGKWSARVDNTITTGSEPWNIVISPDGKRVFVANSGQDTITVINAATRTIIGHVNLRNSRCNDPDRQRHFQPRGLAVTQDSKRLYVTRFLSFTKRNGVQADDQGREGLVCRLDINTNAATIGGYRVAGAIRLQPQATGFQIVVNGTPVKGTASIAFPNQMQSIVIHGNKAYLPNIAAAPEGALQFQNSTEAYVNTIEGINGGSQRDGGALNLHLGARDPEAGKKKLFFANTWAIAFTSQSGGAGNAYAVSAGSDLLVKLKVAGNGNLSFTVDGDTTRYIDLNDPDSGATRGNNAGKNPQGIVIDSRGRFAYVNNFVSRNVSIVDVTQDRVVKVVRTTPLPAPGSQAERILVGAEVFFSSRGHFNRIGSVSADERLSQDGWQNCASCHFKGLTDGIVWSFNPGPRKSISLGGTFNPRNRNQQRVLNYSALRDEVQDFDLNTRNVSSAGALATPIDCSAPPPPQSNFDPNHGLILGDVNANQPPCVINDFLKPNTNRNQATVTLPGSTAKVKALDAMKQWVQFAVRPLNGPLNSRQIRSGVSFAQIQQGRDLFRTGGCARCHNGGLWTKSIINFTPPPKNTDIFCERNVNNAALPGCQKDPVFGNPVALQFLDRFLENVGSFNLGVRGRGNPIDGNIGAAEKAAPVVVAGVLQAQQDALGIDYNNDGKGVGFSVQSLLGIFGAPPYMHNGACETIACVVDDKKHRTGNGRFGDQLTDPAKRALVVKFVESISTQTTPF